MRGRFLGRYRQSPFGANGVDRQRASAAIEWGVYGVPENLRGRASTDTSPTS